MSCTRRNCLMGHDGPMGLKLPGPRTPCFGLGRAGCYQNSVRLRRSFYSINVMFRPMAHCRIRRCVVPPAFASTATDPTPCPRSACPTDSRSAPLLARLPSIACLAQRTGPNVRRSIPSVMCCPIASVESSSSHGRYGRHSSSDNGDSTPAAPACRSEHWPVIVAVTFGSNEPRCVLLFDVDELP
jgi:hypothetical protein